MQIKRIRKYQKKTKKILNLKFKIKKTNQKNLQNFNKKYKNILKKFKSLEKFDILYTDLK